MEPAIVVLGVAELSGLEYRVWQLCPHAEIFFQTGTVPQTLARAAASHRSPILVLDDSRPETIEAIPAALQASLHADIALGGSIVCWRRDVLSAALASPTRFAHLRCLLRRAARFGASRTVFDPAAPLASRDAHMLSWPWEADDAARTGG